MSDDRRRVARLIRDHLARERMSREQFAFRTKLGKSTVDKLLVGLFSERTLAVVEAETGLRLRPPDAPGGHAPPPRWDGGTASAEDGLVRPETGYARSGAFHIAYQVSGRGPLDLVATPGFISHQDHQWEEPRFARYLRRLASSFRLITFDKRGTGLSDRDAGDPTLEARMDDIRAVMDAAGSRRTAILGVSEGGPMAAVFAATYPERTQALVLYGSFAEFSSWVPTPERLRAVEEYIEHAWGSGGIVPAFCPGLAEDGRFREWWRRHERLGASPSAALALMRMNSRIDIRGILPSIRVPTLVVHRAGDAFIDVEGGRHLAAHIPGARYVELPGRDHPPWAGDTEGLLDAVEAFLGDLRTGTPPGPVLATVLSARAGGPGRRDGHAALRAAVAREVARHRGRVVPGTEDGALAVFDGPARAVRCGHALQASAAGCGLDVRVGLHTGEVELAPDALVGPAVRIAARIAALARAGEVLVSGTVRDLVAGSGLRFRDRGATTLDGLDEPLRLLLAEPGPAAPA
jgi:pimeloyl-ACP methyl ester carboxylesterase